MGLDQFVSTYKEPEKEDIQYWRKHNAIHGWMQALWESRGGAGEFNYVPVRLYEEDLDQLELDIKNGNLPETTGFFFGSPSHIQSEEEKKEDLEFVSTARKALKQGLVVEYNSSW